MKKSLSKLQYISCFSGIGGLEGEGEPQVVCEINEDCQLVLSRRFPNSFIHSDITNLRPPSVELVAGGWPCQDISIAGQQMGLTGERSGLLVELIRVANEAGATSIVAENVGNLLRMRQGQEFNDAITMFHDAGFDFVTWRLLNARDFGLPQHRVRLIIIASKVRELAMSLFRELPDLPSTCTEESKRDQASGFYWTAGTHSINYSRGYAPTVKIGSSLNIASPPAIHFGNVVRQLTSLEALHLQGFTEGFDEVSTSAMYRMAGNAVPRPIGRWVFSGIESPSDATPSPQKLSEQLKFEISSEPNYDFARVGMSVKGARDFFYIPERNLRSVNLIDFIDISDTSSLSARAAAGLLGRLARSNQKIPSDLHDCLVKLAPGS